MKVGIVGLGMAGLRTAMLLEAQGLTVELFEARSRLGGRVYTVTDHNGLAYEAGGEWLDSNHHRCLRLVREAGLEPDLRGLWPCRATYRGQSCSEDLMWGDALEDELRVEAAAREMARELHSPSWANPHFADWDVATLASFLAEQSQSERGLWWVTAKARALAGDDPERLGLLGWLSGYLKSRDRDVDDARAYRVPGGFHRLCEWMQSRIHADASLGTVLKRVRQDSSGVTLSFEKGSTRLDAVVLTLPPPALERVIFEPALSVPKRCAIEASQMGRTVKIVWQFRRAWWRDDANGGRLLSDGPLQQVWDATLGEVPTLAATISGEEAERWLSLGEPVRAGLYELREAFGMEPEGFERGILHNWVSDPLSRGGASHMPPGYVLEHARHCPTSEGRIFFAGETTSPWYGTVEGALESAERVASELVG